MTNPQVDTWFDIIKTFQHHQSQNKSLIGAELFRTGGFEVVKLGTDCLGTPSSQQQMLKSESLMYHCATPSISISAQRMNAIYDTT